MKNVRVVPVIAVALAVAFAALPASSADESNSFQQPYLAYLGREVPSSAAPVWSSAVPIPQDVWTGAAGIPAGVVRYAHAQCLGENRFFIFSGVTTGGTLTGQAARYDAGPNTWAPLAAFPIPSEGPSGVCYQGKIYVAGGSLALTTLHIYDIASNTWSTGAPIPRPVVLSAMGANAGKIYVIGGDSDFPPSNGVSSAVDVYDIASNTSSPRAPMPTAAVSAGFAQIGTFVYVVGGWGVTSPGVNVALAQRYDMATNTWTAGPPFTSARADLVLAASATALYAIGGDNNGGGFFDISAVVERLAVATWPAGTWTAADALPTARSGHKGGFCTNAFLPASGEVWSTGGIATPFPTFTNTNQYLNAEACVVVAASVSARSLAVDAAGNRVMDPTEAAIMAPTWHNDNPTVAAGVTGALTNFTGPAGGTYTIVDGAATYGDIAGNADASCGSNCYTLMASAVTRPTQHWDTTVLETMSTANTKTWTLHIGESFTDVLPTSNFYRFIETMLHKGITGGCQVGLYCPTNATTREQMSVFVLLAKEGAGYTPPACTTPIFSDVPASSPFCRFIEELFRRGVVGGCAANPPQYCPTNAVTRAQMSVFVLKTLDPALNPPNCTTPVFTDVPATDPFCKWIEELVRRGVTGGCSANPPMYCPNDPVTREQMGVFLTQTFSLNLYGI